MRAIRPFVILLFGIAAVWMFLPHAARAQSHTTLDEYRRIVSETLALTQQANALTAAARAPLLNRAADILASVQTVQTPSGARVAVDNGELISLVRDAAKTETALARLTALRDALNEPLATVNLNDLALLENILNHPPFVRAENWYDAILRALAEFFDGLFNNAARGIFDTRDVLVIIAILVVIGVLSYFLRQLRRNLVPEETLPPPLSEHDARTPAEAFDNAQKFINAGDYRSAVRQLYLATLLMLDQRGRIKYDPTLTNREYLRQAAIDARAAAALQPIVETFDRTWYGFEPISAQEFDAYRRRVEGVREL